MRIRGWILIVTGALLALVLGFTFWSSRSFSAAVARYDQQITGDLEADEEVARAGAAAIDLETGIRDYQLTGAPRLLEPYQRAERTRARDLDRLVERMAGDPEQAAAAARVRDGVAGWLRAVAAPIVAGTLPGGPEGQLALTTEGKQRMDAIRGDLDLLHRGVLKRRADHERELRLYQDDFVHHNVELGAVRMALVLLVALAIYAKLARPLVTLGAKAQRIGSGDFADLGRALDLGDGEVARTFNRMSERLALDRQELAAQSAELTRVNQELQAQTEALRRNQEELALRNQELSRASRLKSDFLAGMSHELRTPMNAVIGFSELLMAGDYGPIDPRQRAVVGDVLDAARQLLALINDVLDLSKIEAGRGEVTLSPIDVAGPIDRACALLAAAAAGRKITIERRLPRGLGVSADPDRLRQVLINLLSNAVKFTPEGGRVTIEASAEAGRVRVAVRDTGIGIAEADFGKLFAPFSQLESGYARRFQGTGLGLSICKRLIEMMGGEIGLASVLGEGSTFFVLLDAATPGADPRVDPLPRAPEPSPPDPAAPRYRVLVVDDNEMNRRVVLGMLKPLPCDAIEATDGPSGLRAVREHHPDVILMDLQMPGMDGLTATRHLKEDPATRSIPVIAVTASAMPADVERSLAAGCFAHLSKPLSRAALRRALEDAMAGRGDGAAPMPPGG